MAIRRNRLTIPQHIWLAFWLATIPDPQLYKWGIKKTAAQASLSLGFIITPANIDKALMGLRKEFPRSARRWPREIMIQQVTVERKEPRLEGPVTNITVHQGTTRLETIDG